MSKKSVQKKLKGGFFSFNQKIPSGITLTSEETKEVIELWKEDVEVIKTNTEQLEAHVVNYKDEKLIAEAEKILG